MGRRKRNKMLAAVAEKKNRLKRAANKVKRALKPLTAGEKLHLAMHGKAVEKTK